MSNGNSTRLKQPKNGVHLELDLGEQDSKKHKGQHRDSGLDVNLGLNLLPNYARFADLMTQPLDGNGYVFEKNNSSINGIKTVSTDRYLQRSHPTDGGDEEMPQRMHGRLARRRSSSSLADFSSDHHGRGSWTEDSQPLGVSQTQSQSHRGVNNILKIPVADLMSNNGMNNNASWATNQPRFRSPNSSEGRWQPEPDEEPEWQADAPGARPGRLVGVRPSPSARMRPRSEPPRLRLPRNQANHVDQDEFENDLEPLPWEVRVPQETSMVIERGVSKLPRDTGLSMHSPVQGGQKAGNIYDRKKRKASPKDKKKQKKDIKRKPTGLDTTNADAEDSPQKDFNNPKGKQSGDNPCFPGYSPKNRDKSPFKRASKTFLEMRAASPNKTSVGMSKKQDRETNDRAASKANEKPSHKGYSPTPSKDKLSLQRSASPSPSFKNSEIPKPGPQRSASSAKGVKVATKGSPKMNTSKAKQSNPGKKSNTDVGAKDGMSTTVCYPGFSPPSYNTTKSPSKVTNKPLKSPSRGKKGKTDNKSPNKRSVSPRTGRVQSAKSKSSTTNTRCDNRCSSRSRQASPAASQTRCPPTYSPPCEAPSKSSTNMPFGPFSSALDVGRAIVNSASNFRPNSPQPKKSPSLFKSRSKTSLKSGSPVVRTEPSWGSLADTAMPMQPSFLPTFYDDFRALPPTSRVNLRSPSQGMLDSSGAWHSGYPTMDSPLSPRNDTAAVQGSFSNRSIVQSTSGTARGSPSRTAKTRNGQHKTGKKNKKSKKDRNENKQHKTKSGKKRRAKSAGGREGRAPGRADSGESLPRPPSAEKCVPAYNPCTAGDSPKSKPKERSPSPKQGVTPKKDQQTTPSKSRLGALCKKCKEFSPKGKLALKWPGSCRRRCGQSMPRLGMIGRIGQAFGSQLRSIARGNRFPFPGLTPLYISDAGLEEWFHYPDAEEEPEDNGPANRAPSKPSSSRLTPGAAGLQSGASTPGVKARLSGRSDDSAAMITADDGERTPSKQGLLTDVADALESGSQTQGADDTDAAGEPQTAGEDTADEQSYDKKKSKMAESQESEAQCYRMRATVRNNKEVVRVDLEECSGSMYTSKKAFRDQPRHRVGRRRSASRDRDGVSRGVRRGGGGGGGASSRRGTSRGHTGSTKSGGNTKRSAGEGRSGSESPSSKDGDGNKGLSDSEQHQHRRKRHAASSSPGDDSSGTEDRATVKRKNDRGKRHDKQPSRRVAESKGNKYSSGKHRKVTSASEGSDSYSATKEDAHELSQSSDPDRESKCRRIVVSSDTGQDEGSVKVRCMSSDSDKDCKLIKTCRRKRLRGLKKSHHEDTITEDEVECKEYLCGERKLVKVCTPSPRRLKRGHAQRVEEDSSGIDNSANRSSSNAVASSRFGRSPARMRREHPEGPESPLRKFSSSQHSFDSLPLDSRGQSCHRSPSDSLVQRRSSYTNKRKAEGDLLRRPGSSNGSPVDPAVCSNLRAPRGSPHHAATVSRPYAGDEKSVVTSDNRQSESFLGPTSHGNLGPSSLPDSEKHDEALNSYVSGSDRDDQPAKIKGRMKFLSVDGGALSGDKKNVSSKSTAVGIQNGTVKMTASPRDMKIIRCNPDKAFEKSAGEGMSASFRSSVDSFALQDEEFFLSRPTPDPDSIARYERDSRYIKMRQRRLEKLERSLNTCHPESVGFAPKSQYLNRVSRRKRSNAGAVSPVGDYDAVVARCARSPTSCRRDDGRASPERHAHRYLPQSKVKHPELLDQFSRIITPEQALRLAETRNVISTDSDASGLVANVYKNPMIGQKDASQNNDWEPRLREQAAPSANSRGCAAVNKEPTYRALLSQGDSLCTSDDRFLTPPSMNCEDSFKSYHHRQSAKDHSGSKSKAIVPHYYETNNSSLLSSAQGIERLGDDERYFKNKMVNDADYRDRPDFINATDVSHCLEPVCDVSSDNKKAWSSYDSCVSKTRSNVKDIQFIRCTTRVPLPGDHLSHGDVTSNDTGLERAESIQFPNAFNVFDKAGRLEVRKGLISPDLEHIRYSHGCGIKGPKLSPSPTYENNLSKYHNSLIKEEEFGKSKALRLGSDSDFHPSFVESGIGEENTASPDSKQSSTHTRLVPQEHRDTNQSSNSDGDHNTSAANTGPSTEHAYHTGAIDTLQLLDNEDSSPLPPAARKVVTTESLSACDVSSAQCSPAVTQFNHLGVPLRRSQSSRLAASVPRPKKYFAESESEWSISSDDDHLIQMVKSLPAIFPHRSAHDRVFENIRRNSMRALIYAASISNLSSHKKLRSVEEEGDGPKSLKYAVHKVRKLLNGNSSLRPEQCPKFECTSCCDKGLLSLNTKDASVGTVDYGSQSLSKNEIGVAERSHNSHSSRKEVVDSSTSCHLLSPPPPQTHSMLANACKQISSVLKVARGSSVDPSGIELSLPCKPSVDGSNGDSVDQLPNSAYLQSVAGPNRSDLIKLCAEDGEEFWILSAEAIKKLNVMPEVNNVSTLDTQVDACNSQEVKDVKAGLKHRLDSVDITCGSDSSDQKQEGHRSEEESSPPVFDEELYNNKNQSKNAGDDCVQSNTINFSNSCDFKADSKRHKAVSRLNDDSESCGLWSASQPCYSLNYEDFLKISGVESAASYLHSEIGTTVKRPVDSRSVEMKQADAKSDTDTKLPKAMTDSKKKRKKCLQGTNVNSSHVARTDSEPIQTKDIPNTMVGADLCGHSKEPKSSSVDPCITMVKKHKRRRRGYSSVDPPCFDRDSSCFTEETSCDSHCREIKDKDRSGTMKDRGDQVGTDLDKAIYDHLKACWGLNKENLRGTEGGDTGGDPLTHQWPSLTGVKTRLSRARNTRSISKSSKSTQANDTLSLVSSTTLTSDEDSESVTDSIFDKPSVVVVSLSGKGNDSPIRAADNVMPREHKSILLDWLKTVVPRSLLSSMQGREEESSCTEQMVQKKRGSSEPRRSYKHLSGRRHRRASSAGPSEGFQDNSSNALTTTDLSLDNASPRSYLNRNSSQSGDNGEEGRSNRKKRKRTGGAAAAGREHCLSRQTLKQAGTTASPNTNLIASNARQISSSPLGNKNKSKNSHKTRKETSPGKPGSWERHRLIKTSAASYEVKKRKEKSRRASHPGSPRGREACYHCGNTDFSLNRVQESRVDPASFISDEGDVCMSHSTAPVTASSSESSTFHSCQEQNLTTLRERFDRLVADLDNVYKRGGEAQPQTPYHPSYGSFMEMPVKESFNNLGPKYSAAATAEREAAAVLTRRRESRVSFGSEFLRDYKFETMPEPVSREEDLLRQYSYSLPERRFSGFNNLSASFLSTRMRSDFGGGFKNRRNSLLGDFKFQSFRSPSSDPVLDLYSSGASPLARRFSGVPTGSWTDESNNKPVTERNTSNRAYLGDLCEGVFGENVRPFDHSLSGEVNIADGGGSLAYRQILGTNWNESANNGHDDDSSSKSSTDEDFLEFDVEGGGSGAAASHSTTGASGINSARVPGDPCQSMFSTLVKEQMADVRSSSHLGASNLSREHFFELLSKTPGLVPDSQCLCPGCGCRSNNYQGSRKQDLFSRLPSMAMRNINGSGNLTGKEPYTAAACGGLSIGALPKEDTGGNNRTSDEEFVSAIEHLSSTVRNCHNLMPRHLWQECQEVKDTCNHQQDSSFYMGDGPGGFGRLAREDCLMHLDEDHAEMSKLYRKQHCGPDGILPDIGSSKTDRGQPWQAGAAGSNAESVACQNAGTQAQFFNTATHTCRSQAGRPPRKMMTQWYQDGIDLTKSLDAITQGRVQKYTNCTLSEHLLGKVQGKDKACGHLSLECGGQKGACNQHEDLDDDDDEEEEEEEDDDDDPREFDEAVEEEEDDEDVGESEEEEEEDDDDDDDADDNLEEANEDENHNKEIIRQRGSREAGQRDGALDNLHAMKDFPEAGKQAGDMNVESKVATITNGRFTAGDTAGRPERPGEEEKLELKPSPHSPRAGPRQRKFSFDQIKVPAIEKERVRFACDESGDWAEIGRGSYGCVYLGLLDASIEVAIKDFYEASSWELVIHEARMLMFLQDTGITPRLYGLRRRFDVTKQPSEYCIIMEYFGDGRTLFNVMSDKIPLRTDEWLDIVGQLVAGLRLIHRKGVLINDLKADNILVDLTKGRKVIRYIDVGMATYRQGLTFQLPEDQMNRYNFLAPEVREGGRTTTRSDIYSLGYMLEQMCRLADSALGGLRKLVSRCMDKRASRRPDLDDIVSQVHRFIGAKASRSAASSSPREHPLLNNSV